MIKVLCQMPNCNEWAVQGHRLCEKHLKESEERKKKRAFENVKRNNEGMYSTYRWRMLRKKVIENHPYCSCCGCSGSADNPLTLDHIQAPQGNEDIFYNEENLQVLCRNCHNKKTAEEVKGRHI